MGQLCYITHLAGLMPATSNLTGADTIFCLAVAGFTGSTYAKDERKGGKERQRDEENEEKK